MHTNDTTLLPALIKAHKEITDYRTELANAPANELPAEWDAVVMSEWLCEMASDIASDSACLRNRNGSGYVRFGIDSTAGFLASFWETHHLLASTLKDYPKAVRTYFAHADEMIAQAIADNSPTPPAKPELTSEQKADLAERATHALFATIHNELDPKAEHDLGGWSALNHEERFDSIRNHAEQIVQNLSKVVRCA